MWALEDGPRAAHLNVIVGHEDGKAAQVAALTGDAAIPAAQLPAAGGVPVPATLIVTLPEGTDQLLPCLKFTHYLWADGMVGEVSLEATLGF